MSTRPRIMHLDSQSYKTMPWKNGGGSTTELAIHPEDSSLSHPFQWRISLAQLDGSGPFSSFPGYDRIIAQLSGKAMRLTHEGQASKNLSPLEPYSFPGEWATAGFLQGRAEDFNLMTRRGSCEGELIPLRLRGHALVYCAETSLIFVASGAVQVTVEAESYELNGRDALRIEGLAHHAIDLRGATADLFIIHISNS